ncbi:polysaccharide biosynthesis protein PslH [Anaerolineae bacterium]|nr:polysaccharide biosynthesis protein PslH [Anaerolineae bacterium]
MNILFVTQNYPYPSVRHAGGQEFWWLIDALRQHHQVYVLTFDDPIQPVSREALAPYVQDVKVIRYALSLPQKLRAALWAGLRGYVFQSFRLRRREWEMVRLVRRWCKRYAIHVVHCGWTETGRYLKAVDPPVLRVLDEIDVRYVVEEWALQRQQQRGRLEPDEVKQRKAEELRYCQSADLVVTRSQADLDSLRQYLPGLKGFVLPPRSNVPHLLHIDPAEAVTGQVLFTGAMNRQANVEAVRWFVSEVWPLVKMRNPQAQFVIAGSQPPQQITALAGQPGIVVTGDVPDLYPYYAHSRVVVAPMWEASGCLTKIMDGIAAGRPVVATSIANRGTAAPCVRVADDPAAFAEAINAFLENDGLWVEAAQRARDYALHHFNWQAAVSALENLYQSQVSSRLGDVLKGERR